MTGHGGQRGMSLLEMMIALAVSSLVLVSLAGVVFGAYVLTRTWGQRIYESGAGALLPDQLQADSHRLSLCPGSSDPYRLQLCEAGSPAPVVIYATADGCDSAGSCDVARTYVPTNGSTVLARSLRSRPQFTVSCRSAGAVSTGQVLVQGLLYPAGEGGAAPSSADKPLVVYFRTPVGGCA